MHPEDQDVIDDFLLEGGLAGAVAQGAVSRPPRPGGREWTGLAGGTGGGGIGAGGIAADGEGLEERSGGGRNSLQCPKKGAQ